MQASWTLVAVAGCAGLVLGAFGAMAVPVVADIIEDMVGAVAYFVRRIIYGLGAAALLAVVVLALYVAYRLNT